MTKNKYNISKELINAVLEDEIKDVYFAPNGRFFETWNEIRDDRVNTNDFFFLCKEWSANCKGIVITSEFTFGNKYNGQAAVRIDGKEEKYFESESEQQAVFDACQWILENKGKE